VPIGHLEHGARVRAVPFTPRSTEPPSAPRTSGRPISPWPSPCAWPRCWTTPCPLPP